MEDWARIAAGITAGILQQISDGVDFDGEDIPGIVGAQIPAEQAANAGKITVLCLAAIGPFSQPVVRQTLLAQAEIAGLLTP